MSSKRPAMDGFIPRKPQNNNLDAETNNKGHYGSLNSMPKKSTVNYFDSPAESKAKINHDGGLFGNLSDADDWFIEPTDKKYHKKRRDKKSLTQKPKHLFRHIVKLLIILSVLALIGAGGYVVYRFISASGSIFQGSVIDIFKNQPLQEDSNGRSNFVILKIFL